MSQPIGINKVAQRPSARRGVNVRRVRSEPSGIAGTDPRRPIVISNDATAWRGLFRLAYERLLDGLMIGGSQEHDKAVFLVPAGTIVRFEVHQSLRARISTSRRLAYLCFLMKPRRRDRSTGPAEIVHSVSVEVPSGGDVEAVNHEMAGIGAKFLWRREAASGCTVKYRLSRTSLRRLVRLAGGSRWRQEVRMRLSVAVFSCRHRVIWVPWVREYGSAVFSGGIRMSVYRVA